MYSTNLRVHYKPEIVYKYLLHVVPGIHHIYSIGWLREECEKQNVNPRRLQEDIDQFMEDYDKRIAAVCLSSRCGPLASRIQYQCTCTDALLVYITA